MDAFEIENLRRRLSGIASHLETLADRMEPSDTPFDELTILQLA